MQGPVKGQIPALHPAKECAEEAVAGNRLLQPLHGVQEQDIP